ncbi:flagellar basal body rod protein [Heyndrickxia sp. NPDC080065]|uniref:lmo0954 family membrane protein n=1 Tax=Heyndrickxia sp. NPDC080065 TaxID=3390568 RepID=UPI003CFBFBBB
MKKFLMLSLAVLLIIIALGSIGNIIGLIISVAITYFSLKQFLKSDSFGGKLLWVIIGLIGLTSTFSNLPALAGILAVYLLYVGYKEWKKDEKPTHSSHSSNDPFESFDKQWNDMKGKY